MAQKLFNDKIGAVSHTAGVIYLAASKLTIGGQQYVNTSSVSRTITADVTLAANTLYYIYAVVSGGSTAVRISTNADTLGPSGFSSWKLVGAFYTNGSSAVTTPLLKAFADGETMRRSRFEIKASGSQSIAHQASEGSEVKFTNWASPLFDSHGGWDAANSRYVFQSDGYYLVSAKIVREGVTTIGPALMLKPFIDGVDADNRFSRTDAPTATQSDMTLTGTRLFKFNQGQYLDLRVFQNNGSALNFGGTTLTILQMPEFL